MKNFIKRPAVGTVDALEHRFSSGVHPLAGLIIITTKLRHLSEQGSLILSPGCIIRLKSQSVPSRCLDATVGEEQRSDGVPRPTPSSTSTKNGLIISSLNPGLASSTRGFARRCPVCGATTVSRAGLPLSKENVSP